MSGAVEKEMRMCRTKKRFEKPSKAWDAAHKVGRYKKVALFVYRCPYCRGFHLTRQKQRF